MGDQGEISSYPSETDVCLHTEFIFSDKYFFYSRAYI